MGRLVLRTSQRFILTVDNTSIMTETSLPLIAALASTGLISLAPNLLLLIFPNYAMGEGETSNLMSLGQAMAAGGLLGDVFLHTLPHAQNLEEEQVGLWVIAGFIVFFVCDLFLADHRHKHQHHHNEGEAKKMKDNGSKKEDFHISPRILLNLAGDALHNFTDGLAIGASFSIQGSLIQHDASLLNLISSRGGLATISILLHELPHELGDFATLVRAGCSKKQAILLQFATAVAAMIGTVVGVFAAEGYGKEQLLYVTAGGFVYLAAVTILPEVLDEHASFRFRLLQLMSFTSGVAFMLAVSAIEHQSGGRSGHSHSHHEHSHAQHIDHSSEERYHEEHEGHQHHDHGHSDEL